MVDMTTVFDDLLATNKICAQTFDGAGLSGTPARHLAIVTCMDTRIDPLGQFGLERGDAHILRNAGARVNEDALRSLVLSVQLLGVTAIAIIGHTDCATARITNGSVRATLIEKGISPDAVADLDVHPVGDQQQAIRDDLALLAASPLLPHDLALAGFIFNVATGELEPVTP